MKSSQKSTWHRVRPQEMPAITIIMIILSMIIPTLILQSSAHGVSSSLKPSWILPSQGSPPGLALSGPPSAYVGTPEGRETHPAQGLWEDSPQ